MKSFLITSVFLTISWLVHVDNDVMAQEILAEANFSIDNVKYLELEGGFCNVVLNGYSGQSLKMDGSIKGSGNPDKYEIMYREENNKVKVWVEHPVNLWGTIHGKLTFDVPWDVLVNANCSSGNIEAHNLKASSIDLEASSGNITAQKLEGELNIRCSSGNITLSDQHGQTSARTSSGNIRIENINGNLTSHASSGNMQIFTVSGDVVALGSSGNVRLQDIEGKVDIETSSGNIRGERIMLTDNSRFKASSGSVIIGLLNEENDLSFDLDAGSGGLYALGSNADDRLILKKGPILITGVTTSGNQRYTKE